MKSREEIAQAMEKLVHKRFNNHTLLKELETIFNQPITLTHSDCEADELLGDYCWTFYIGVDFGIFDIYYLPHKCTDGTGNDFYVTEVGYSFGC